MQDLIESSADTRYSNQDAEAPDMSDVAVNRRRVSGIAWQVTSLSLMQQQEAFISNLIERSEATRLPGQDYPVSVEERLETRRTQLIESLVNFSSSGRYTDQDSNPPTPRVAKQGDPHELVTVGDFIRTSPTLPQGEHASGSAGVARVGDVEKKEKGGTLRKIKGMVRRGSLGLGLKGPSYGECRPSKLG